MPTSNGRTLSAPRRDHDEQPPISTVWRPPETDPSELQHRFGDSVLLEFIRGHSSSAILHELVQNEYDAGGRILHVSFGHSGLEVSGNGTPIDRKGWKRLSVTLGTGSVPELSGPLEEKANGIGSKNFGLRSLFSLATEFSFVPMETKHCSTSTMVHQRHPDRTLQLQERVECASTYHTEQWALAAYILSPPMQKLTF